MKNVKEYIKRYWWMYMMSVTLFLMIENCSRLGENKHIMLEAIKESEYIRGYNDGYTHGILEDKN
jgi:hypothetical protein